MTGWEFAKYFVDLAYDHWLTTIVFLLCLVPWREINLVRVDKFTKNVLGDTE